MNIEVFNGEKLPEARRCTVCADQALPMRVSRVLDSQSAIALRKGVAAEVDISLVDEVCEGEWLLVHSGVALARWVGTED